jgi:hypothetical protein
MGGTDIKWNSPIPASTCKFALDNFHLQEPPYWIEWDANKISHYFIPYQGRTKDFFHQGGSKAYMPKKVPNIQRIINNDILKIVNIVFSRRAVAPPPAIPLCTALYPIYVWHVH